MTGRRRTFAVGPRRLAIVLAFQALLLTVPAAFGIGAGPAAAACPCYADVLVMVNPNGTGAYGFADSTRLNVWQYYSVSQMGIPDNSASFLQISSNGAQYKCQSVAYDHTTHSGAYLRLNSGTANRPPLYRINTYQDLRLKKLSSGAVADNRIGSIGIYCSDVT
jgi:hypothetical protein